MPLPAEDTVSSDEEQLPSPYTFPLVSRQSTAASVEDEKTEAMLQRYPSGSRVLQRTISQASSIEREEHSRPGSVNNGTSVSSDPSGTTVGATASGVSFVLPTASQDDKPTGYGVRRPPLRPRLLSPIHSTDSMPIYRGSYVQSLATSPPGSRPVSVRQMQMSPRSHSRSQSVSRSESPTGNKDNEKTVSSHHIYATMSQNIIEDKMALNEVERDRFGLEELRDGFFDAVFVPQTLIEKLAYQSLNADVEAEEEKEPPTILELAIENIKSVVRLIMIKSTGCPEFVKAFIAYFIAYCLCLVNPIGHWLGRHNYLMALATIMHHAGHSSGSQIEVTLLTIAGDALGVGWGALAVYVSNSTGVAHKGYGGILAAFSLVIIAVTSWFRAYYIRLYHGMVAFSFVFVCVTIFDTSNPNYDWRKLFDISIPYLFGTLLALIVNLVVFPDFGHKSIFVGFRLLLAECSSYVEAIKNCEVDPESDHVDQLNTVSHELSLAFREMSNEITFSTLSYQEALELRNKLQVFAGRLRILPSPNFQDEAGPNLSTYGTLKETFLEPAIEILNLLFLSLERCGTYFEYLYAPTAETRNIPFQQELQKDYEELNALQARMVKTYKEFSYSQDLADLEWQNFRAVDVLLYIHFLTDASHSYSDFLNCVIGLKERKWKLSFIHYSLSRYLRTNTRQITHDRGGQSAFFFLHSMKDIRDIFKQIQLMNMGKLQEKFGEERIELKNGVLNPISSNEDQPLRYKIWRGLHKLQQHETRFALRTSVTVFLLTLPAYIKVSSTWYNQYDIWIAPLISIVILHPRVGGNIHDLFIRSTFAILGVIWAAIGIRAGNGNSIVLAVFAAIFMLPMFYRFVQSSHPRSGLIACFSFTMVSQSMRLAKIQYGSTIIQHAWPRGCAIVVGVTFSILVNWVFWPFVARHEVRKGMSTILHYLSQCYQSVADRYLYKNEGNDPTPLTLSLSEVQEARLRAGLTAFEDLILMTRHEPSIRGSFNLVPYMVLLKSCRRLQQKISEARISSTYFSLYDHEAETEVRQKLIPLRRDAVASVIYCFYVLSCAFRTRNKIPNYLPSAPMSRKLLFDAILTYRTPEIEVTQDGDNTETSENSIAGPSTQNSTFENNLNKTHANTPNKEKGPQLWAIVHETSFSRTFTEIAEELEKIISYSKYILGEEKL